MAWSDSDLLDLTERWIYERLLADLLPEDMRNENRIHKSVIPSGSAWPSVKFTYQGSEHHKGVGPDATYFSTLYYAVRGVRPGTATGALRPIAGSIYEALHGKEETTAFGLVVLGSTFEDHYRLEHDEGNQRYVELGGIYRIDVQPTEE